jgi:predicted dehydrogenase
VADIQEAAIGRVPHEIAVFDSLQSLLENAKLDVVSICTPNYLHATQAIQCLDAGAHVIIEKPMAMSVTECDAIIEAGQRNNRVLFPVKQNRYNPPVARVRDLLDQGALGEICFVQVNCFWNRSDAYYAQSPWRGKKSLDGGCLFTQFSHFVDILYFLNGEVGSIAGSIANYMHQHNTEIEDTGSFTMHAANGSLVSFSFTTCAYEKNMEGSITIFGTKGTIRIGGQYLNTLDYAVLQNGITFDTQQLPSAEANDYGLYQGSMSNHHLVIQNVVDVLLHGKEKTTSDADGRAVIGIIERMYSVAKHL